ncbi:MAG: alanine dehydrogenase [Alphaproteobacteria bacterium]
MLIGVPKEIKTSEYRVGLTPAAVGEYVAHGHDALVETGAGGGMAASDDDYRLAGAAIAASAAEVFQAADMIVKVKEPQAQEWAQLRAGQILYTYLHLAADRPQTEGLMSCGVTAIAYETVTDDEGGLPLLAPMSEVAGRLSIQAAAAALQRPNGGRGVLLGGVPGVPPGRVVVIGGGVVGTHAARMAVGLGAQVTILERSVPRLRELDDLFQGRVVTQYSTRESLADRSMLSMMKSRSVLVDVAIDQGGCFETSVATTHDDPTYEVDDVVHYCVANMPGAVPLTSSHALNHATLPFGLALADHGLQALRGSRHLMNGLSVHEGKITHPAVAQSLDLPFTDPATLTFA